MPVNQDGSQAKNQNDGEEYPAVRTPVESHNDRILVCGASGCNIVILALEVLHETLRLYLRHFNPAVHVRMQSCKGGNAGRGAGTRSGGTGSIRPARASFKKLS